MRGGIYGAPHSYWEGAIGHCRALGGRYRAPHNYSEGAIGHNRLLWDL